jgi:DNA-binding LacI/PurR family transcriptional regulator
LPSNRDAKNKVRGRIRNLDDLAQLSGFAKSTVSRAMANSPLISDETTRTIQRLARTHGFSVNRNARKLTGRTNTIAIALDFPALEGSRLSDPFHFELLADVAKALAVREQEVLLCSPRMDEARGYEELIASRGADGIVFLGQGARETYLRDLSKTAVPFVVWGAVRADTPYCAVGTDNVRGGRLAGQRLAALGRKRILFVGAEGHIEFELRRAGLEEGLALSKSDATIIDVHSSDLAYESTLALVRSWLDSGVPPPDGVFAASDTKAMTVYAALFERGLRVPHDVSVVGYDDIPFATHMTPPLTTIRQNTSQGGALLVEKLMQRIEGLRPRSALLPTELVVRGS